MHVVRDTARDVDVQALWLAIDSSGSAFVASVTSLPTDNDLSAVVVKLDAERGAERWRTKLGADTFPGAFAFDPSDGNVVVGTRVRSYYSSVAKLAAVDGHGVWSHDLGTASVFALAATPGGQVVVGGSAESAGSAHGVVALSGADGAERWRGAPSMYVQGIAIAPDGDVAAVGGVGSGVFSDLAVAKLNGADGTERWRKTINGSSTSVDGTSISWDVGTAVAVDSHGDVVAVGWTQNEIGENLPTDIDFVVEKLSGATGETIWRHDLAGPDQSDDRGLGVSIDAAGDVFALGWVATEDPKRPFTLFKLDGSTGDVRWASRLTGPSGDGFVWGLAFAGADVVIGGELEVAGNPQLAIARLDAATGEPIWVRTIDGSGPEREESYNHDRAGTVFLDGSGRIIVGGYTKNSPDLDEAADPTVVQLADRLAGARLMMRERRRRQGTGRLVVDVRDASLLASPGFGADPTAAGAVLEVAIASTGEQVSFPLPADGWSRRKGRVPGALRFVYADPPGRGGPCRSAVLVSGKRFAVRCKGLLGIRLDRPQEALTVRLSVADAGVRYCARFGGSVTRDRPTTTTADGIFEARDAPAPVSCP